MGRRRKQRARYVPQATVEPVTRMEEVVLKVAGFRIPVRPLRGRVSDLLLAAFDVSQAAESLPGPVTEEQIRKLVDERLAGMPGPEEGDEAG